MKYSLKKYSLVSPFGDGFLPVAIVRWENGEEQTVYGVEPDGSMAVCKSPLNDADPDDPGHLALSLALVQMLRERVPDHELAVDDEPWIDP